MSSTLAVNDKEHPVELKSLRDAPAWIDCPYCGNRAMTRVFKKSGKKIGWGNFNEQPWKSR
jgi:hypothetical protein